MPSAVPVSAPASLADRSRLFHALSDETRLAILELLGGGECCVCELQDSLDAAQSRLSFHLKVLRDARLVRDRKDGRWSYYTLNPERLEGAAAAAIGLMNSAGRPARRAAPTATLHQLTRRRSKAARADAITQPLGSAHGKRTPSNRTPGRAEGSGGCCP
jgi:ArsR family transcriptional regulator, arsenate/arsenite/antimonite-responsive transcriptional repressor